ncbi:MAG: hypothetical protein ACK559_16035 [bacterium]
MVMVRLRMVSPPTGLPTPCSVAGSMVTVVPFRWACSTTIEHLFSPRSAAGRGMPPQYCSTVTTRGFRSQPRTSPRVMATYSPAVRQRPLGVQSISARRLPR